MASWVIDKVQCDVSWNKKVFGLGLGLVKVARLSILAAVFSVLPEGIQLKTLSRIISTFSSGQS